VLLFTQYKNTWPYRQCSLWGAQTRSTTRQFARWNLIQAHLQNSIFNIVYLSPSHFNAWKVSLVACRHLHGCTIACALRQTFAQCKIFLERTLHTVRGVTRVLSQGRQNSFERSPPVTIRGPLANTQKKSKMIVNADGMWISALVKNTRKRSQNAKTTTIYWKLKTKIIVNIKM